MSRFRKRPYSRFALLCTALVCVITAVFVFATRDHSRSFSQSTGSVTAAPSPLQSPVDAKSSQRQLASSSEPSHDIAGSALPRLSDIQLVTDHLLNARRSSSSVQPSFVQTAPTQEPDLESARLNAQHVLDCFYSRSCSDFSEKSIFVDRKVQINAAQGPITAQTPLVILVDSKCAAKSPSKQVQDILRGVSDISAMMPYHRVAWKTPRAYTVAELQSAFANEDCVVGVTREQKVRTVGFAVPTQVPSAQVNLISESAANGWKKIYNSVTGATKATVVAVVDTGVDTTHPNLIPNLLHDAKNNIYAVDCVASANVCKTATSLIDHVGHGTHCAGLVAASPDGVYEIYGVAPSAVRVMAVKASDSDSFNTSDVANGVTFASLNGADVISLSLGGYDDDPSFDDAIRAALLRGVVVVAAAGNDSKDIAATPFYPANLRRNSSYTGMLVVGSIVAEDFTKSSFSNYSNLVVDIAAPGSASNPMSMGIPSTYSLVAGARFAYLAGTSMATPQVAGAAALLKSWLTTNSATLPSGQNLATTLTGIITSSAVADSNNQSYWASGHRLDLNALATYAQAQYPVLVPTVITQQPMSVTINQGQSASFSVTATGPGTLTYQWKFKGANLSGQTSSTLTVASAQAANAGAYTVAVTSAGTTITSSAATLTVNTAPVLVNSGVSAPINKIGSSTTLTATMTSNLATTYQWYKNGVAIGGATSMTYTIPKSDLSALGTYTVRATNSLGSTTSQAYSLAVSLHTLDSGSSITINKNPEIGFSGGFR